MLSTLLSSIPHIPENERHIPRIAIVEMMRWIMDYRVSKHTRVISGIETTTEIIWNGNEIKKIVVTEKNWDGVASIFEYEVDIEMVDGEVRHIWITSDSEFLEFYKHDMEAVLRTGTLGKQNGTGFEIRYDLDELGNINEEHIEHIGVDENGNRVASWLSERTLYGYEDELPVIRIEPDTITYFRYDEYGNLLVEEDTPNIVDEGDIVITTIEYVYETIGDGSKRLVCIKEDDFCATHLYYNEYGFLSKVVSVREDGSVFLTEEYKYDKDWRLEEIIVKDPELLEDNELEPYGWSVDRIEYLNTRQTASISSGESFRNMTTENGIPFGKRVLAVLNTIGGKE